MVGAVASAFGNGARGSWLGRRMAPGWGVRSVELEGRTGARMLGRGRIGNTLVLAEGKSTAGSDLYDGVTLTGEKLNGRMGESSERCRSAAAG